MLRLAGNTADTAAFDPNAGKEEPRAGRRQNGPKGGWAARFFPSLQNPALK